MKKFIFTFCIVSFAILPSCNLFNKGQKYIVNEDVIMPDDRETVQNNLHQTKENKYNAKDLSQGHLRSDWAILTVMGKEIKSEEVPFLKFDYDKGIVYGYNGCNTINGKYTYNPQDSTLSFGNIITTMRYCVDSDIIERKVNEAINNTAKYSWRTENSNHYIMFYDKSGEEVMVLMHQEFDFLNGIWSVYKINEKLNNNSEMKLVIDVDQSKVHGNTGCNILNGSLDINPKTVNSISFHSIATTRRACPNQSEETELVVALEEIVYAIPVDANMVRLLDNKHKTVLELKRTTD